MPDNQAEQHSTTSASADSSVKAVQELANSCRQELSQLQAEIMEMEILVRQTSAEIERLEPRVAEMSRKIREVDAQTESYSRAEVKELYNAAQEVQMRHFMMQGQLSQLSYKSSVLQRYEALLRRVLAALPQLQVLAQSEDLARSQPAPQRRLADYSASPGADGSFLAQTVRAQEEERLRAAELINDGPVQLLANVVLRAEVCERLVGVGDQRALEELRQLKASVASSLRDARHFVYDLRPVAIGELGLVPTLQRYAQTLADKTRIGVTVIAEGVDARWPEHLELAAFRIAQDAIAQSLARRQVSQIKIKLTASDTELRVKVQDNGLPDIGDRRPGADSRRKRPDTTRLRERLQLLGARAEEEIVPGKGHSLDVVIPLR